MRIGEVVVYPRCPQWGQGRIKEIKEGRLAVVFFLNAGEKKAYLDDLEMIIQSKDPRIENLDLQVDISTPYCTFEEAKQWFIKKWPGLFDDPDYLREERTWKVEAHQMMVEKLNRETLESLLAARQYHEVVIRALSVEQKLYLLLSTFEKSALKDALKPDGSAQNFSMALHDYLYGESDIKERFLRFARMLEELPRKQAKVYGWPAQTIFLFIRYPEKYLFLKPEVTKKAAQRLRFDIQYRPEPNWTTYKKVLELGELIKEDLIRSNLPPQDLIDVQSFIFAIESYQGHP